jgi:hypothetical protein
MSNVEHGGQNAEIERAVKLLELRDHGNSLVDTMALELKIKALPKGVRLMAKKRLELRRQAAGPAHHIPGDAQANIETLYRAKQEESRAKATIQGAVRHLPEAIEAAGNALDESGMIEAVSAGTEVAMPGVGTAIVQAPKVVAAPFKVNSAFKAHEQAKKIEEIGSEAESNAGAGGTVLGRRDLEAQAAVRRQKGDPDRMRCRSGGERVGESELTGQHQYWSDEPDANAPATQPATTSFAAAGNARDIAGQLKKKRNQKLVDAGTALVPKSAELLELRRLMRGNGWTGVQNQQKRHDLATELLELAYRYHDEDSLSVMEELVRDEKEREKLRMLYSSPVNEGTAATRLAEKLAGRRS